MKTFLIELTGDTPLLHHKMTEEEMVKILFKTKEKKNVVKTYDSPRQIAEAHAYKNNDGIYFIPTGYIKGAFSHVSSDYKQTTGKKSIKSIAGGVFVPVSESAIILNKQNNEPVKNFEVQIDKGNNRNAGSGTAVIICRPRFDNWKVRFYAEIDTDLLSETQAQTILEDAGRRAGIGSWRVAKGGVYGKFSVTLFQELSGVEKDKFYNLNKLVV